jgi:transposase-like protein
VAKDYVKTRELLFGLLMGGSFIDTACKLVGIDDNTYYRWLKCAPEGYPEDDFRERMDQASAMAEVEGVKVFRAAALTDWRAALAFLEIRFPTRWGRKLSLEYSGSIEETQKIELTMEEKTKRLLKAIKAAVRAQEKEAASAEIAPEIKVDPS